MLEARVRRLKQATRTVEEQEYHKLVLLVGDFSSGKTRLMRQVCDEIGGVYLNVNLELTHRLLIINARTYATRASRILQELCDDLEPGRPLFLDNVELLFSPEVGCLNPVDLFKKVSRERLVVLSLPCRLKGQAWVETPKGYSDFYIAFVKALQVPEDQIPEIKTLLEENFVPVNSHYKRPEMLGKRELEARRQQRLLREFDDILDQARRGQRLKDVRKGAILAGSAQCYHDKRFEDILCVGRMLHRRIVESSTGIFDFIDIAEAKVG